MQIIFHIDLNAFFASAEVAMNPSLKGKPLVISGNNRRSIVTTASYEARKYGIHSAMPLFKAKELCRHLIVRPVNFDLYRKLSQSFFDLIASYSSILEIASIDECYVDFTDYVQKQNIHPYLLAYELQQRVWQELHLSCSIGIAPNKFMAKMASDMKKPMGITILNRKNYKELLWPLDIADMFGIGVLRNEVHKCIDRLPERIVRFIGGQGIVEHGFLVNLGVKVRVYGIAESQACIVLVTKFYVGITDMQVSVFRHQILRRSGLGQILDSFLVLSLLVIGKAKHIQIVALQFLFFFRIGFQVLGGHTIVLPFIIQFSQHAVQFRLVFLVVAFQ